MLEKHLQLEANWLLEPEHARSGNLRIIFNCYSRAVAMFSLYVHRQCLLAQWPGKAFGKMQNICRAVRNLDRILVDAEYGESFLWLIGIDMDLADPVVHFQVMIARYHFETSCNTELLLMLMKTRLLCEWLPQHSAVVQIIAWMDELEFIGNCEAMRCDNTDFDFGKTDG